MGDWAGFDDAWLDEQRSRGRVAVDVATRGDGGPRDGAPNGREKPNGAKAPANRNFSKPRQREHQMQEALVELCGYKEAEYPELHMLYANVNGQYRRGQRPEPGMKAGIPDLFLAAPAGRSGAERSESSSIDGVYHGLYLELKAPGGACGLSSWTGSMRCAGRAIALGWRGHSPARGALSKTT